MNSFGSMDEYLESQGVKYVELPPVVETLPMDSDIQRLKDEVEVANGQRDRYKHLYSEKVDNEFRLHNSVKDWLIEKVQNDEVTKSVAEELAELFCFETTRTVPISGTISFRGEVEVSMFDDISNLSSYDLEINGLDIALDSEDVVNLEYDVEDVDID